MDRQLKQRVVGAAVLVVLGVIFIPLFLDQRPHPTELPEVVPVSPPAREFVSPVAPIDDHEMDALEVLSEQRVEIRADDAAVPDTPQDALPPASVAPPAPPPRAETAAPEEAPVPFEPPLRQAPATATAPPPPAQPPTAADSAPQWVVQVGSFSEQNNATRLAEKLRAAGFSAFIERRQEQGGTAHKVRVGPEPDRAAAARLRAQLADRFDLPGLILRAP
ncbi:MAG: SPOR domain-containing protein [Gammaproteobacteria bacterium]